MADKETLMIVCNATCKAGHPCPTGAGYIDAEGGTWRHVHADRARCAVISKRDRKRGEAPKVTP